MPSRYCGGVQRRESGSLSKLSGSAWLLAAAVPATWLLAACGSHNDLMSTVALPAQQTADFVDGVGVPPAQADQHGADQQGADLQAGKLDLSASQLGYLDALASVGIKPTSELRALSIGSYVCQARAAGQTDEAVRDYVTPMVRTDVADAHASLPQLPAITADAAVTEYIRAATTKLC